MGEFVLDKDVTLFVILWGVISILICIIYDRLFPKRKLVNKTKGYLVKDVWMYDKSGTISEKNRVTYRFDINGKEYKKTFYLSGNVDYEIDIEYCRGYWDAHPANYVRANPRIYIKLLLCVLLAPYLSRLIVNLFISK